jgi:5-methylcytosine-specific restriction endonuclease McrA
MESETKVCSRCKELLPLSVFGTHRKRSGNGKVYDFRRNVCRACYNVYERERKGLPPKQPRVKKAKPVRQAMVRTCVQCGSKFETKHPRKKFCSMVCHIKAFSGKYYHYQPKIKNCEHCGKEMTGKRYCSPECWTEARRIKQSQNKKAFLSTDKGKEYRKVHTSRNNQRRKGDKAGIDFTPAQWRAALRYFDHKCAYCGEKLTKAEQEHYFPLSKGGRLTRSNIIPACPACNNKKSNRDPIEWIAGLPNALVAYARITLYFMQVSH